MAKTYWTKKQALTEFKRSVEPYILKVYGPRDKPAMRCAWNDWTDGLNRDGIISDHQDNTWTNPYP